MIYQPRLEIVNDGSAIQVWQDWGIYDTEEEGNKVVLELIEKIRNGEFDNKITDKEKAKGYNLNACLEVRNDNWDLLEIFEYGDT